jgi:hypothetical protein
MSAMIFFHPDYTVGAGIPPVQSRRKNGAESRAIPPVGNCRTRSQEQRPVHPTLKILNIQGPKQQFRNPRYFYYDERCFFRQAADRSGREPDYE